MDEIQEIKIAGLLPDARKLDISTSVPVYVGFAKPVDSEDEIRMYFKILSKRGVFIESICSLLAKFVGIPVPEPYLVFQTDTAQLDHCDIETPIFGTVDTGVPSYGHFLTNDNEPELIAKLKKMNHYNSCSVFDEFIGNNDRHFSNLFVRNNELISIDHEKAIQEHHHFSQPNWNNTLINYLSNDSQFTRKRNMELCCKELTHYHKIPFALLVAKTLATNYLDDKTISEAVEFLENRINFIEEHIRKQFKAVAIQRSLR